MSAFTNWLDFFCRQNNMENCYFLKEFFGTILKEDSEEKCFCQNEDMYCLLIYLSFFFQISVCGWLLTMISWGLVMVTLPFSLFVCFKVGHFYITTTYIVFTFNLKRILWSFFFAEPKLIWFSVNKVNNVIRFSKQIFVIDVKGQLISKCLFCVFNSPKKQTKIIRLEGP